MTRTNLVATSVATALAMGIAAPLFAQALEEITVTGSRISQNGMVTPTPVTAVSAAELEKMSPGTLIDGLNQLPQFFGNTTSEQANGGQNSGGSNVNLRGAGINRTLVLLDGRRVVSSNRFGTVDVNMFPDALIRGVETVTGGASASYGTDAVAGVVNFLLDTKFEGVKLHGQVGQTSRNDGDNAEFSIAFGHAFGEKLNVIGSYGQVNTNAINSFDSLRARPWFSQASRVTNPNPAGPAEIIRLYVSPTDFSNTGVIVEPPLAATNPQAATLNPFLAQLNRLEFLGDGTTRRLPFTGVGNLNAGCKCFASNSQNYGVDGDTEVANASSQANGFLHLNYEFNDALNFFAQGMYGNTRTSDRRESVALLSTWEGRIYSDNVYLPANVRNILNAMPANRRYFGFGVFLPDNEDNPMGDSRQVTDNRLYAGTIGFKSTFNDGFMQGWSMDGYYQFGENRQDFITQNGIRTDRLPLAMDAVTDPNGNTVCRVSLATFDPTGIFKDCVPINLFGGVANITPQAAAWIRDDGKIGRQIVKQHVAELVLSGDVWKGIGAGPFAAAFGGTWRKDDLNQYTVDPSDEFPALPDGTRLSTLGILPASLRGVVPQGESGGVAGYNGIPGLRFVPAGFKGDANSSSVLFSSLRTITGGYNVKEVFGELQIPLLRDVAFARRLELNTAARWADYSGSGEIWAWKLGANWEINDQIRFRATKSQDVRAATLQERFDQTRGGVNVTDPANGNALVTTASFSGGNPNVNPETADTTTVGIVLRPSFLEGFSLSLDWYKIDIDQAIAQLTAQTLVTGCFNGDQTLCQYVIRRDNAPNGVIDRVENLFINLANQRISGLDLEVTYRRSIELFGGGAEGIGWRLYATQLRENSTQNPGAARDERLGQLQNQLSLPEYKFSTNLSYTNGPISAFIQGRYIGDGKLDRTRTESAVAIPGVATIDDNTVGSVFYTDLTLGYRVEALGDFDVSFNVTNLFDRWPPLAPGVMGRTGTTEFNSALHDVIGRRYSLGVNYKF